MKRLLITAVMMCLLCAVASAAPLVQVTVSEPVATTVPETVRYADGAFQVDTQATAIDFGSTYILDWSTVAPFLRQLPKLERCDMYRSPIRPSWAEALAAEFPNVTFGWTLSFGSGSDQHQVRTDVTAFSTLHLSGDWGHSSDELKVLRFCRNLQALDIGHNHVDDISWLAEMPQLKVLIIAINDITDISPLAELHELEYLEIFNNYITDISPLSGLTKLKDLNLCWNNIKDYSPIYGLTGLERLWLYNSYNRYSVASIPAEELNKLKAALPNTYMDNVNEPSAGGWREHPRFDTIHAYFRTGVYVPFEESGEGE